MSRTSDFILDFVNATRFLKRHRAFSLAGIVILALGIGAATSLFSVAHAVLLEKLPVHNPDELVLLRYVVPRELSLGIMTGWNSLTDEGDATSSSLPYPFYDFIRREEQALESVFAFSGLGRLTVATQQGSQRVSGQLVSGGFFSDLGLKPQVGRLIDPEDDTPGSQPVAVLSHGFWMRSFSGDAGVVGTTIDINRRPYVVVGIAPAGFTGTLQLGTRPALFVPLAERQILHHFAENTDREHYWWLQIMGRLAEGVSREQAEAALSAAFQNRMREALERQNPDQDLTTVSPPKIRLEPGGQGQMEGRRRAASNIHVLSLLVGLLLLLSCVNLAALLVSKSSARRRELAVKLSLGASRWRLLRELSAEVVILALAAGVTGVMLALWSMDLMARLVAFNTPLSVSINWSVVLFAVGVSLLTGLLVGLFTALRASSLDPGPALKESDTKVTFSRSSAWIGRGLIAVQVSLAVVLLVTTGLFLGTLRNLMRVDVGFDPNRLVVFDLEPEASGYRPEQRLELYQDIARNLELLPAVRQVSYSAQRLIDGSNSAIQFRIAGEPSESSVDLHYVGPGFLTTMGIPIHLGRDLTRADGPSRPVAIISQSLADRYFPAQNPIGQIIEPELTDFIRQLMPGLIASFEIVGVAGDIHYSGLRDNLRPAVFLPALQNGAYMRSATFVARIAAPADQILPEVESIVQRRDRNLPILGLQTYLQQIRGSVEQESQFARMSGLFSLIAVLLVAAGIYGTLSHSVTARLREFGIRIALGANERRIQLLVLHELVAVGVGIAGGLLIAWAAAHSFSAFLFQLEPGDPWMLAGGALLILLVAVMTASFPARRASHADPVAVLRSE